MTASPLLYVFYLAAIASSGYFFHLGRRLSLLRRSMAALHGLTAVTVLLIPVAYTWIRQSDPNPFLALMGFFAVSSVGSIIYSMVALRVDWRVHLLHLPTLFVLKVNLVVGALLLLGT